MALAWWLLFTLPVVRLGSLRRIVREEQSKVLLASAGVYFVLSALKIPSVTGSCSHPTGVGLAVILFGPGVVAVLGRRSAVPGALLAHGGLIGGLIGPIGGVDVGVFLCAMLADLMTYFVTSVQLGVAFPDPATGQVDRSPSLWASSA